MILIFLIAGWVLGILAASLFRLPTPVWLILLPLPLAYLVLFWRNLPLRIWHFSLLFFILGALRYQLAQPTELSQQLAQFNEQGNASLIGIVVDAPDVRQTQTLVRVDATKIQTRGEWLDVHGSALVSVPRDTPVKYGDEVQVDGAPETPPDGSDFSYRDYLARENVFTLVRYARLYTIASGKGDSFRAALYGFKDAAKVAVNQLLPEPSAALLTGILLGDDQGIPPKLKDDFAATNTAHIIAISGFNIALLVSVLAFLFRRPASILQARALTSPSAGTAARTTAAVTGHLSTVLILVFLILYALLVGASASVVRACIMGALVVVAFEFGRQNWALNALAIAAFVMSLLNPYVFWDVGFQLSFLATLGLLVYAPRLEARAESWLKQRTSASRARRVLDFSRDALIVSAATFLVTAPLLIVYFHRVSPIGFLTNFLILPVQPPIMLLGGGATMLQMAANVLNAVPLVGLIVGALAQVVAWGAYICLQYTILVVQATVAIPFGSFEVARVDLPLVILFYGLLFGVTGLGVRRAAELLVARLWVPLALLAVATIFVWTTAIAAPDPRTRISFIAASEGDATFIRTRDGFRILVNGTGEPNTLLSYLGGQLPPWDRRIDLVVATHSDNDNLSSLNAVLERYTVGQVVEPPAPARPGVGFAKWSELLSKRGIVSNVAEPDMQLGVGEAKLDVAYAATNTVLRLEVDGKTFLLAPRLTGTEWKELLEGEAELDADVAVLPSEIEKEFLERVTPETVILVVGGRPQDKPRAEMLRLLEGAAVLRTDERGTITWVLDRAQVSLETQK